MLAQTPHPDTSQVVRNVQRLANCQNQQKRGPSGNSQLPPAKRGIPVPAGKRNFSQEGSSVASTIQVQNSTPSSLLNNSCIADLTQRVTSTQSGPQQWSKKYSNRHAGYMQWLHTSTRRDHRQTQCIALHSAPHPALPAPPLPSAVLKTCLPPSLIQKPARSLQIHWERKVPKGVCDRGSVYTRIIGLRRS